MERLASLIPPPRRHLLTYHGVLAPAARLRPVLVPKPTSSGEGCKHLAGGSSVGTKGPAVKPRSTTYMTWSNLLKRVFGILVFRCPHCGGPRRLIATITDPLLIGKMLACLQERKATPLPP